MGTTFSANGSEHSRSDPVRGARRRHVRRRVLDRRSPDAVRLWKELIEEQNVAVAMLMGLVGVGLAIIIAAAIH